MDAINNLNAAVAELKITVDALVVPVNNDVAIQAAADGINAAVATLKSKVA